MPTPVPYTIHTLYPRPLQPSATGVLRETAAAHPEGGLENGTLRLYADRIVLSGGERAQIIPLHAVREVRTWAGETINFAIQHADDAVLSLRVEAGPAFKFAIDRQRTQLRAAA
ncbi:MAG: hypothetical protein RhofKO_43560 [Rhodothermales bacterium]